MSRKEDECKPLEHGASPFPGNINQLIVSLEEYRAQLVKTGGQIEEFVNPKYKDDTKTTFKSPTRRGLAHHPVHSSHFT